MFVSFFCVVFMPHGSLPSYRCIYFAPFASIAIVCSILVKSASGIWRSEQTLLKEDIGLEIVGQVGEW